MDTLDLKAMNVLSSQARISWAELAQQLGLSAPAAADRVRKLEEAGVIRGYTALLDAHALGYALVAFVEVTFGKTKHRRGFRKAIQLMPEILECHHIAGDADYLLKVVTRDASHLDQFVGDRIRAVPGVLRTRTTIVLSTQKEMTFQPPEPEKEKTPEKQK